MTRRLPGSCAGLSRLRLPSEPEQGVRRAACTRVGARREYGEVNDAGGRKPARLAPRRQPCRHKAQSRLHGFAFFMMIDRFMRLCVVYV